MDPTREVDKNGVAGGLVKQETGLLQTRKVRDGMHMWVINILVDEWRACVYAGRVSV